jgi:FAD/FMN-containing dehydrogenase
MAEKEQELAKIVGSQNVLSSPEVLEEYSRDMSFVPRIRPGCLVKPRTVEEVKGLIKWANETLTPLVPISSGAPHFRGDTVPGAGGAVLLDLSGMKKIIRLDRRNRVAMIEPGVTFGELIPQVEKEGMRLNMPLLPRSTKSVIGSLLEREPVIMPLYQWAAVDPLVCVEISFGTNVTLRTGDAFGPGNLEVQWKAMQAQSNPQGPGQTDFGWVAQGAQGTMGIVSWATVKTEVLPTVQKAYLAGSNKLERLADFIYRLVWLRIVDECLVLNNTALAAMLAKNNKEYNSLREALPQWALFFCQAGYEYFPEERVTYQEHQMRAAAQQFGMEPEKSLAGVSAYELLRLLARPSEDPYWKLRRKGAFQEIPFTTTLDRVPKLVGVMYETAAQHGYLSSDIGIYVQPMVMGSSCHCEFNLFYDPSDAAEAAKIRNLYVQAGEALMNAGAFFSRPYGDLADMAFRRDAQTTAALKKAKQILDPNNILNPGKLFF